MINWFRRDNFKEYKDRLRQAFPPTLKNDLEAVFDILPFEVNQVKLNDGQTHKVDSLINPLTLTVQHNDQPLSIPYRLYFNEPDAEKEGNLSDTQKAILNCIFLRHHDGYLRQRRLEGLVDRNEYWITPFTFQLLGEHVFEILEVLDKHINEKNIDNYRRFSKENPKYSLQTESRMISYWNEYYRWTKFPRLKDYLGLRLVNRIKGRSVKNS